jgi:hypothetical protein
LASLVILMIEAEQPEGLSARKLVVETAKHNVLTAYTLDDGMDLLRRFPRVDAILVHASLLEENPEFISAIREREPDVPIILTAPFGNAPRGLANFVVDSHNPQDLLGLLNSKQIPPRFPS